jgi:signal transduction histidine kinase
MNATNRFSQFGLIAWLGLSYLVAAVVAAGMVYLAPLGWPLPRQLVAGILLGLAAGLLLSLPVRSAVETAGVALSKLSRGQTIAALPIDWQRRWGPLAELLESVDALGAREREVARLRDDLMRSTGQAAAQAERNRLARDLHDSIKQQLYAINVSAAAALARWGTDLSGARAAVEDVRRAAQAALAEMAALLQQLRPAPLAAAGLLDALAEQCEALAHRTGAAVSVDLGQPSDAAAYAAVVDEQRLAPGAEEAIFRIAQEALSNIARHARAGKVTLQLRVTDSALCLDISDDGQGFVPAETGAGDRPENGRSASTYGLVGMRDRAAGIGAALEVTSAPGSGTHVVLTVPLAEPATQQNAALRAEVGTLSRKVEIWDAVGLGAGFFALVVAQGLIPRLSGGSFPPAALAVSITLLLACLVGARIAWSRVQSATLAVTLACGADSPIVWRMRRETAWRRVWVGLMAVVMVPSALMPKAWPAYPVAALAVGVACALLAGAAIARGYRATEGYWKRLSGKARASELDQAWRQRFSWVPVLLGTAAGYFVYRYGSPPAPLAWPPSSELVLDILITFFVNLILLAFVVSYLQLRNWRTWQGGNSSEAT